jgi:hypothetical protein
MNDCHNILVYLKNNEEKYLKDNFDNEFYINKEKRLLYIKEKIYQDKVINLEHFEMIRQLVIEKGGFLNFNLRSIFYNLIFNIKVESDDDNFYTKNSYKTNGRFINEIKQDLDRSIINSLINNKEESNFDKFKENLFKFIEIFFDLTNYEYYQGFQEISLYFYILNLMNNNNDHLSTPYIILVRFAEFYLHNFINKKDFSNTLSNLSLIINEIDNKVSSSLLEITNTQPYYALSWIITWLAHKNTNIFLQYRIIDYLLCSHPNTILFLSAIIIIEEYYNLLKIYNLDELEEVFI